MFTHIVVGTDGSPDAKEALNAAAHLASIAPQGMVHVVTAYEPLSSAEIHRLDVELPDEFHEQLTGDLLVRPIVEEANATLRAQGIGHTTLETRKPPAEAILVLAGTVGADLIVVGSRGQGAMDRMRHGSVSTKVMHHSPCSVLVVKSPDHTGRRQ